MNKKYNLCILLITIVEIICLFTPYSITEKHYIYDNSVVYHGISLFNKMYTKSLFNVYTSSTFSLTVAFLCIAIFTAIVYLLKLKNSQAKICKKSFSISIIHTVTMIVLLICACTVENTGVYYKYAYSFSWMTYLILALNIISLVLATLSKSNEKNIKQNVFDNVDNNVKIDISNQKSTIEILTEYKNLLDAGLITQEDFEIKKKELLSL